MIHGLWDNHHAFDCLINELNSLNISVFAPDLKHDFGRISLIDLAVQLDEYISSNIGENIPIDLLGFSMGGLVARIWLQNMGGDRRVGRFISVGCPHKGTLLAQLIPPFLFRGISEMGRQSPLLLDLNSNISKLANIECISFFCRWDLMVLPGWQAALPIGKAFEMNVFTHKSMIINHKAIDLLVDAIINDYSKDLSVL